MNNTTHRWYNPRGWSFFTGNIGKVAELDPLSKYADGFTIKITDVVNKPGLETAYGSTKLRKATAEEIKLATTKNITELVPGRWYKLTEGRLPLESPWHIKFKGIEGSSITSINHLTGTNKYEESTGFFGKLGDYSYELIDVSTIQQYLPVGHPDKLPILGYKVDDWILAANQHVNYFGKVSALPSTYNKNITVSCWYAESDGVKGLSNSSGELVKFIRLARPEEIPGYEPVEDPLIAEAKIRYPIGTKFQCAHLPTTEDAWGIIEPQHKFVVEHNSVSLSLDGKDSTSAQSGWHGCLRTSDGIWAEVISATTKLKEMTVSRTDSGTSSMPLPNAVWGFGSSIPKKEKELKHQKPIMVKTKAKRTKIFSI